MTGTGDPQGPSTPGDPWRYGSGQSAQHGLPPAQPPGPWPPHPAFYPPYPVGRPTNTLAILALVLAFVFAPAAIVLGVLARRQIRQTGEDGHGLATAGLVIGIVFTALTALFIVGYVIFFVTLLSTLPHTAT
jgi:hypothetical protein